MMSETANHTLSMTPAEKGADRPQQIPDEPITRQRIEEAGATMLYQGKSNKADLLETDLGYGPIVIKDFSKKSRWIRTLGRLQIRRECNIYRWLGPRPGVPQFYGRVDSYAMALEKLESVEICHAPGLPNDAERLFESFRGLIDSLHEQGFAHLDLRARKNVLCDAQGVVHVLDFGSAACLRPGGIAHRLLFGLLARIDDAAVLKYKQHLKIDHYTEQEAAAIKQMERWSVLWPFNRKKKHTS
jgi:hypothetical protein